MTELSEARKRSNKKWYDKNKARKQYLNQRSVAKNFILKRATAEDLDNLENCIQQRRKELN